VLAAAGDPALPIGSVTALGSPFDVRQVPLVAPLRPLLTVTDALGPIGRVYRAAGGLPQPLVRWAVQLSAFQSLVTRPLAIARHLDDADYLAQLEAVDRFTRDVVAYPGRTFGQLYHRLLKGDALVEGAFDLGDRTVAVADVGVPVLVCAGANDDIAPVGSVKALVPLLSGSPDVRFEIVPGGHLGMLTGREARDGTWPVVDAWVDEWTHSEPEAEPARSATQRRTTKRAPAKRTATKKPATEPATEPAMKTAAPPSEKEEAEPTIGVNPKRRYGSASSRALRR
jgi:polyhydroxyalkanoate synthase